ncbi:Uncharacterised protein [Klebsiella pneumoniae]|nr:Uncharacterised protein [Klebsiella pneumoniae]
MALLFPAVFTTTELNDFNFIAATVCNHFSFNFNTFNDWSADLDVFTICNHQNLVKLNSFTCCDVQLFQANDLTFADPVYAKTLQMTSAENDLMVKKRHFTDSRLFAAFLQYNHKI